MEPRVGATRGVLDLLDNGELPQRADIENEGEAPVNVPEAPEMPNGTEDVAGPVPANPPPVPAAAAGSNSGPNSEGQPEMEVSPAVSVDQGVDTQYEPDFVQVPVPEDDDDDDLLIGDTECFLVHPSQDQVWEINLHETDVDPAQLPSPSQALHYVLLATPERKKRVEVRLRDLTGDERQVRCR